MKSKPIIRRNKKWQKIGLNVLGVIAVMCLAFMQSDTIKSYTEQNWFSAAPKIFILCYCAITLLDLWFRQISPSIKLATAKKHSRSLLVTFGQTAISRYSSYGLEFNIMIAQRTISPHFENRRLKFYRYNFKTDWQYPEDSVPEDLKLRLDEGCCGLVYSGKTRRKGIGECNIELMKTNGDDIQQIFNFEHENATLTDDVTLVASYAIYREYSEEKRIIGIFNVHSKQPNAGRILGTVNQDNLNTEIKYLTEFFVNYF